jgi:hypothetical protein
VYAVGAPLGLENTVSDGIVSGMRTLAGQNLIQMTAPISLGSSGGPVVDDAGLLIGVSVGHLPDGQNLNFAVPVEELKAIIVSPSGSVPFPPLTARFTESGPPSGSARGLLESLPTRPLETANDTEVRISLLGCYGNRPRDVIVCVCDFSRHSVDNRDRTLGIWGATLLSLSGGQAASDISSDLTSSFPFSGGTRGVTVRFSTRTENSVRLYFRFIVAFDFATRPILELGVDGRRADRLYRFAPVPIVPIDETKDQTRRLFVSR